MNVPEAADLIALGGLIVFCAVRARPITEAIRWRNALLVEHSSIDDFTWVPPHFPAGFKVERAPPSEEFCEIVRSLGIDRAHTDWDNALTLAAHLVERVEQGGAIHADLITTYRNIRSGGGYCADFVRVYLGLAHASGLTARQWAFSFDGFGGHGHTVVEIFDRQRGKWLLLDVHNNFHALDASTGEPLGALEYREALLGKRSPAVMHRNGPGRLGFIHDHKAIEYYRRGLNQWYLWWGNAVFSYDARPLVRWTSLVSRKLAHVAGVISGAQPRIRIYETRDNAVEVRRMFRLRATLLAGGVLAAVLCVALAAQLAFGSRAPR
jgi:hypothetical protein